MTLLRFSSNAQARSEWLRASTLILLRWLAITGQLLAVLIAAFGVNITLPIAPCLALIAGSAMFNLIFWWWLDKTQNLSERAALNSLLFDMVQLFLLLCLTGGLNNPFALLLLVPVTISATVLSLSSTLIIGLLAIVLSSVLAVFYVDLFTALGDPLRLPELFLWGNWVALVIGIVFLGGYARRVSMESFFMSQALAATQMALEREHKLSLIGGVVAAAAHEMNSPLATIKMTATELLDALESQPALQSDARLIRDQSMRLSDILSDMGHSGKEDLYLRNALALAVITEAAKPHQNRGPILSIKLAVDAGPLCEMPYLPRSPEIIHGLRNLIQNATDFAKEGVDIVLNWSDLWLEITISDDGAGFPTDVLVRIGEPFLRSNRASIKQRKDYKGMGLGLFIAKTLLGRSGATLRFKNTKTAGAQVSLRWKRANLPKQQGALGQNPLIEF